MSEENADTIRRAYEVWNESGPAAVTDQFWAEDAVYREGPGWPNAGTRGPCPIAPLTSVTPVKKKCKKHKKHRSAESAQKKKCKKKKHH